MIRLASDPDSTFAPYAMTNRELTEQFFATSEHGLTAGTKFSIAGAYKTVAGRLVNYQVIGSLTDNAVADDVIVQGFVPPLQNSEGIINVTAYDGNNNPYLLRYNVTNRKFVATGAIPSGTYIRFNLTYAYFA